MKRGGGEGKCVFNDSFQKEYLFSRKRDNLHSSLCTKCNSEISIASCVKSDIKDHLKCEKHLIAVCTNTCNTSRKFVIINDSHKN